jgi:hypothetical protein
MGHIRPRIATLFLLNLPLDPPIIKRVTFGKEYGNQY